MDNFLPRMVYGASIGLAALSGQRVLPALKDTEHEMSVGLRMTFACVSTNAYPNLLPHSLTEH